MVDARDGQRPAFVTGAASGIGRATALRLADDGIPLALFDRDAAGLADTAARIQAAGGTASTQVGDVSDRADVEAAIAGALEEYGDLGTLVNIAGIGVRAPLAETSDEDWDAVMDVNVRGPFLACRALLPHLVETGGGIIVNVGSIASVIGITDRAVYCVSKAAVLGLTRSIAADYARFGIRVNAICPGTVDTEWIGKILADAPDPVATRAAMEARQLDGRMGSPEEVAAGIAFLVSADGRFMNGSAMMMDGAMTAV
ncbi:MAG: SDR family oxidoreductase [Nitriliruptoraceae bacterium]|nr:SDR family oxidoreductase [Nitriliruptoraceae bacterium]